MAVGSDEVAGDGRTLAEVLKGGTWGIVRTPSLTGSSDAFDEGVSCVTASNCMAAGEFANSKGIYGTLAQKWNGSVWKNLAMPTVAGSGASAFDGVACPSASYCAAAGFRPASSRSDWTLTEQWNGSSWKRVASPNPAGGGEYRLNAVSCRSATWCVALGTYQQTANLGVSLVENWTGGAWKVVTAPIKSGATYVNQSGIACTSKSLCVGVGDYTNSADKEFTLAETWNGRTWKVVPSPNAG